MLTRNFFMFAPQYNPNEVYPPAGRPLTKDESDAWVEMQREMDARDAVRTYCNKALYWIRGDVRNINRKLQSLEQAVASV